MTEYYRNWYKEVLSAMPEDIRTEARLQFDEMAESERTDDIVLICEVMKFVRKRIGQSSTNPVSVRVYAKIGMLPEKNVEKIFSYRERHKNMKA